MIFAFLFHLTLKENLSVYHLFSKLISYEKQNLKIKSKYVLENTHAQLPQEGHL